VSRGFPLYGEITTDPVRAWADLHEGRHIVVDPSLLVSLGARVGDTLSLGTSSFVITGTLEDVPGEIGVNAAIGPRVYIPADYLDETGLLVFGSRAEYETVLAMTGELTPRAFVNRFDRRLRAEDLRLRTAGYNEQRLASAIGQLQDFLSVVGLIALLLGGIGVASGVHAFVMRKIDTVAILRCLGASSWQVLGIYSLQAALMGLAGAAVGAVLGIGIQFVLPRVVADFLPVDVEVTLVPFAIATGLGLGVWVALVFALQPLVAVRRISPLQALRRDADTTVLRGTRVDPLRVLVLFAIVSSVLWLGIARAGDVLRGLGFSAGIGAAVAILWGAAALLSWAARRGVRPGWPFVLRQGMAALHRPGNQTRAVVLALGFGVFLMGTLYQLEQNLLRSLGVRLTDARANLVFFDVQQDQRESIERIVRDGGHEIVQSAPIIPMRIASINGQPARDLLNGPAPRTGRLSGIPRRSSRGAGSAGSATATRCSRRPSSRTSRANWRWASVTPSSGTCRALWCPRRSPASARCAGPASNRTSSWSSNRARCGTRRSNSPFSRT
jgi:putative ABC transport system permease protein